MRTLKDYYHILGVDKSAPPEEIKKAYRKLAVRYHPDHNAGDRAAEEKFKEISEAYAVLIDPVKKAEYERARQSRQEPGAGPGPGFSFDQEDFHDVFTRVFASQAFKDMAREFQRSGLRFDERFFEKIFKGRRGFFFGGVFFSHGPGGTRVQRDVGPDFRTSFSRRSAPAEPAVPDRPEPGDGLLTRIGRGARNLARNVLGLPAAAPAVVGGDIRFNLSIPAAQAAEGTEVRLAYRRDGRAQQVSVKVPPGTRDGARLRLKGMGHHDPDGQTGDLYLHVNVEA